MSGFVVCGLTAVKPVGTVQNAPQRFARTCGKTVLCFLVLFSFFTLPIPDGVGLHDPAAIGAGGSGFVFMNELQNLACGVIATQQMGSIMIAHRLVQVLTKQHPAW